MDKPNQIILHGATIRYTFDGTEAEATRGDLSQSFSAQIDKETKRAAHPDAQEQAIAWAKNLQKIDDDTNELSRQERIAERVNAAKSRRAEQRDAKQPKPKTKPAANEGTETP